MSFKLSSILLGHSLDVRALATTEDGWIISTSRDKTAKVWKPNGNNAGFFEAATLTGHKGFVCSVCVLPPSPTYPDGLILTGSIDSKICVFNAKSFESLFILEGHTETVCCLIPGMHPGFALSSSWDVTARVWNIAERRSTLTLTGHTLTVWSVLQMPSGAIITGSADRTIRVHSPDGKHLRTCSGHKDCVRGLASLSEVEFLSCANDATIRKWNVDTAECLDVFYGHKSYIYSMVVSGGVIVSGGEETSVRVWVSKQAQQIPIPVQSVWAVARLPNGDVVTGSNDSIVRVFSADPDRQADPVAQAAYEEEVLSFGRIIETNNQEIGGVKISDLPGKEALYEPGKSDGQTKMIREGTSVFCYSWSAAQGEWAKVGEVTGAQAAPGKTLYNGKNYDYVFNVDIEEGKPPIKLPFNRGDDPWVAAQEFIHRNHLNQMFLDQVANFIITNTKDAEPAFPTAAAVDPFTGGARYIPGSGGGGRGAEGVDPFTGGNRYVPGTSTVAPVTAPGMDPFTGGNRYVPNGTPATPRLFPQTSYLRFDQANLQAILGKLEEFNKSQSVNVPDSSLRDMVDLGNNEANTKPQAIDTLKTLLNWPPEVVFPVLDVTRLAVRKADVNACLCGKEDDLYSTLESHLEPSALPANQMLALRAVCNMMSHSPGEQLVISKRHKLLASVRQLASSKASKALQISLMTLVLNLSVAAVRQRDEACEQELVATLGLVLPWLPEAEAVLRGSVALGTLLSHSQALRTELTPPTLDRLRAAASTAPTPADPTLTKVTSCASQILDLLNLQ